MVHRRNLTYKERDLYNQNHIYIGAERKSRSFLHAIYDVGEKGCTLKSALLENIKIDLIATDNTMKITPNIHDNRNGSSKFNEKTFFTQYYSLEA